jgi:hypothetical protein
VLLYEIGDDLLVGFESLDGGGLVVLHEAAVAGHVGAEDRGELAVEAFLFHADTPFDRRFGRIQDEGDDSKRKANEMRTA